LLRKTENNLEEIGAGGMGVVFRAHDERLDRDVAVKVLPPGSLSDEAARKRFRNEAHALSRLNHSNIAAIYDFDSQDGGELPGDGICRLWAQPFPRYHPRLRATSA
jgi:serine/threonine protein kinase